MAFWISCLYFFSKLSAFDKCLPKRIIPRKSYPQDRRMGLFSEFFGSIAKVLTFSNPAWQLFPFFSVNRLQLYQTEIFSTFSQTRFQLFPSAFSWWFQKRKFYCQSWSPLLSQSLGHQCTTFISCPLAKHLNQPLPWCTFQYKRKSQRAF